MVVVQTSFENMSGIVAAFDVGRAASVAALTEMLAQHLSHRGPDGVGVGASGRSVVANARLAIIDVPGGQQPMRSEDGRVLLVCNGEIYNHGALRQLLTATHDFRSRCDSEVILHLFEESGRECVRRLDGMFAFFVTDGERFIAARDPFGIKPLYLGDDQSGGLWFASEIKALHTRCTSIATVPPGSLVTEARRVRRWFSPSWAERTGTRSSVTPEELIVHLEMAVRKRLMSDVPLGVLLSGGLDSSLVAALGRRYVSSLATFSVGIEGASDLVAARRVAKELGSDHQERIYSVLEVTRRLDEVIYHLESYDASLIRNAVPTYFAADLAAGRVKVVLTGDGADALFARHAHMQRFQDENELHRECVRLLFGLHALTLQRVDRMTMARGIEARVPFLDAAFVDWAMGLAPRLKLRRPPQLEKELLRQAAERLLPPELVQRPKLEPVRGTSTDVVLEQYAAAHISDRDLAQAAVRFPVDTPRTKEELLYRLIFDDLFPGDAARGTVARWRVPIFEERLS